MRSTRSTGSRPQVPGTAAGALRDAGREPGDLDAAGLVVPDDVRGGAGRRRRGARPVPRRPRDDRGRVPQRRADPRERLDVRAPRRRHRVPAARPRTSSRSASTRCDRSWPSSGRRARAGARASSPTTTCAGSGRCCSGGSRRSHPVRPPSGRGAPVRLERRRGDRHRVAVAATAAGRGRRRARRGGAAAVDRPVVGGAGARRDRRAVGSASRLARGRPRRERAVTRGRAPDPGRRALVAPHAREAGPPHGPARRGTR